MRDTNELSSYLFLPYSANYMVCEKKVLPAKKSLDLSRTVEMLHMYKTQK